MKKSTVIQEIMFDYDLYSESEILEKCFDLTPKLLRWLGANHPDNKTRKLFFKATGIEIGEGTVINQNLIVSDSYQKLLIIGDRVAIAPNVTIICESGPNNSQLINNKYVKEELIVKKMIYIENDVWIGSNVSILPGVRIGHNSVIGAGSVITKDVPSSCVVAGVPAKVIRKL